jgi:cytochrome P450
VIFMTFEKLPPGPYLSAAAREETERHPLETMEECQRRYGDLYTIQTPGHPPRVHIACAAALRDLLIARDSELPIVGTSFFGRIVGENAMVFLHGKPHRRIRRLIAPPMASDRVRSYGDMIASITEQVMRREAAGQPTPLMPLTREITLRIIIKIVFGPQEPGKYEQVVEVCTALMDALHITAAGSGAERDEALRELDKLCDQLDGIVQVSLNEGCDGLLHHMSTKSLEQGGVQGDTADRIDRSVRDRPPDAVGVHLRRPPISSGYGVRPGDSSGAPGPDAVPEGGGIRSAALSFASLRPH